MYLLGWRTVQSCLFQCNNAEFFIDMENSSVLSFSRNNGELSVIGIQSVFPFLVVTVLCWDEIVS